MRVKHATLVQQLQFVHFWIEGSATLICSLTWMFCYFVFCFGGTEG